MRADSGERIPPGAHSFRQSDAGARRALAGDPQRGMPPVPLVTDPPASGSGLRSSAANTAPYIERQLASFAQGIRHNDIHEQMRAIARQLTPEEMKAVGGFYGRQNEKLAATE
jgi:hypothetical protein